MTTHSQLVERAYRYLKNTRRCSVVFAEHVCQAVDEFPDAIGWRPRGWSIKVECKVSRADFHADKRKGFNQQGRGMGCEVYYMAPEGILTADDVRGLGIGAGLLVVKGKRLIITTVASARHSEPNCWLREAKSSQLSEIAHLVAEIRRGDFR